LSPAEPPEIVGLSFPASYLAQRVGQPRVKVRTLLPPGEDARTWQPDSSAIASFANADLIVANGAGYEGWVATASLPAEKYVDASKGLLTLSIDGPTHSHGAGGEHSHRGTDPHVWSDPLLYTAQARNVHAALVTADPEGQVVYDGNLAGLEKQLEEIAAELDRVLALRNGRPMFANHPSFSYVAKRGGFDLPAIDLDPATPPSPEQIAEIQARFPAGALIWWEAAPSPSVKAAFPEGFSHLVLDPLEQPAGERYDWFAQARMNLIHMEKAFASPIPPDVGVGPSSGTPEVQVNP
jgi:zinc transport system substrate-binding protein